MIICNAFSISMVPGSCNVSFTQVSVEKARELAVGAESAVGHADTAAIFAEQLGREVPVNRVSVTLWEIRELTRHMEECPWEYPSPKENHDLLVGQYVGPRLPEGTTTLPEGATIQWWHVTL